MCARYWRLGHPWNGNCGSRCRGSVLYFISHDLTMFVYLQSRFRKIHIIKCNLLLSYQAQVGGQPNSVFDSSAGSTWYRNNIATNKGQPNSNEPKPKELRGGCLYQMPMKPSWPTRSPKLTWLRGEGRTPRKGGPYTLVAHTALQHGQIILKKRKRA